MDRNRRISDVVSLWLVYYFIGSSTFTGSGVVELSSHVVRNNTERFLLDFHQENTRPYNARFYCILRLQDGTCSAGEMRPHRKHVIGCALITSAGILLLESVKWRVKRTERKVFFVGHLAKRAPENHSRSRRRCLYSYPKCICPPKTGEFLGCLLFGLPIDQDAAASSALCSVYLLLSVLCGSSLQGFPGWAQSLTHDLARSRQVSRTRFATRQLCKLHYIIVPKLLGSPTADLPLRIRANLCAAALPADLSRLRYKLASSSWTSATVEDTARILCIYQCPGINGCGSAGHTFSLCWKSSLRRLTDFPYVLGHLPSPQRWRYWGPAGHPTCAHAAIRRYFAHCLAAG